MARIVTYTMVLVGIWMLLFFGGISTGTSSLLDLFGIGNGTFTGGAFYATVVGVFAIAGVIAAVTIGIITRQSTESVLVAGFATSLLGMTLIDFVSVISYFFSQCPASSTCGFASYIILALFGVLWAGYLISIVQWWRGNDI